MKKDCTTCLHRLKTLTEQPKCGDCIRYGKHGDYFPEWEINNAKN